jgi:SAM-dependent MidA family methyltransferase
VSHPSEQDNSSRSLPVPDSTALAHSRQLEVHIRQVMDAFGGSIPFSQFMNLALYAPGLGYYSAGAAKLGESGDFVTAPEISSLFSRCLAGQVAQVLEEMGGGDVLELGAGSGVMAADILDELERQGRLPHRYLILEVSADLRQRQQALLATRVPGLLDRVEWLDKLPVGLEGVILANEVMDALPVERFRIKPEGLVAQAVSWSVDGFAWQDVAASDVLQQEWLRLSAGLPARPDAGFTSEICLQLGPWLQALNQSMSRGLMLLIDYGLPRSQYYHPQRNDGTLICHYRHRAHTDPLRYVGIQDITAWVDFTRVAEAAVDLGLEIMGFATQAHFLAGAGIDRLLQLAPADTARQRLDLASQMRKLILPGEMGERFKVIGLSRGLDDCVSGFGMHDLTHTL